MKTIKARHKLIPAIIMLIVAAITMSTASYAWFTMSNRVEVTGINLSVVAPTNILIREEGSGDPFANIVTVASNPVDGRLNHSSSINGEVFFTLDNATAQNVDPLTGTLPATPGIISATTLVAASVDGYYYDYRLELVNTGGLDVQVGLKEISISPVTTSVADLGIIGAIRFAVLDGDTEANLVSGLLFANAADSANAIASSAPTYSASAAVNEYLGNLFLLTKEGEASTNDPVNSRTVIVRVWIEGQDADCVTLHANSEFNIEFAFYVFAEVE